MATQDDLEIDEVLDKILEEVTGPAQKARERLESQLQRLEFERSKVKKAMTRLDRIVKAAKDQSSAPASKPKPAAQQRKRWISEEALGKVRDVFSDPDSSASYTVSEICEITGMSEPTVRQGVGKLSDEHYVYQAGRDSSKTGNPMQYKRAKGV